MTQDKQCIILDFDHTLFNTTLYVAALRDALVRDGVTREEFDNKRHYLKSCCSLVDMDTFIQHLSVSNKALLHNTIHSVIVERAASFIFDDVQTFIDRHQQTHDMYIVTQGDQELQREKVIHSNLQGITDIIITHEKKNVAIASLMEKYEHVSFVDDKEKHLQEVKDAFPDVATYFIKRPEDHPYGTKDVTCACADHVIEGLTF